MKGFKIFNLSHLVVFVFSFLFFFSSQAIADPVEVILTVIDTSLSPGETESFISLYLDNYNDTIAGFQFQLKTDRPDLVSFNFDHDGFDTANTLISGFEYVQALDTSGTGDLLWFRCIANANPFDSIFTTGIPPQQGGLVVKIPVNTTPFADTLSSLTCNLDIIKPFDFSDPWGHSIGVITDTLVDTIYYQCSLWDADSCLEWIMVDGHNEEYDSAYIYEYLSGYLDTTVVVPLHGSVTLNSHYIKCDNDGDGDITVADAVCFVNYLFKTWNQVSCPYVPLCSEPGSIPIVSDLVKLVNYLFKGGPLP